MCYTFVLISCCWFSLNFFLKESLLWNLLKCVWKQILYLSSRFYCPFYVTVDTSFLYIFIAFYVLLWIIKNFLTSSILSLPCNKESFNFQLIIWQFRFNMTPETLNLYLVIIFHKRFYNISKYFFLESHITLTENIFIPNLLC